MLFMNRKSALDVYKKLLGLSEESGTARLQWHSSVRCVIHNV